MTPPRGSFPRPPRPPSASAAERGAELAEIQRRRRRAKGLTVTMGRLDRVRVRWTRIRPAPPASPTDVRPIAERLDALETMVEALQDSVDRQATRHDELARRLQPSELAGALSDDARRRGI